MQNIRLGTRGSQLALWQSNFVKRRLEDSHPSESGLNVELVILKTEGDVAKGPLSQMGGQGLFTKRLQDALLQNEIDLAVHSLKDLPSQTPDGLMLAAVPPRADVRDALLARHPWTLDSIPQGAKIGTGSNRRKSQLLHLRPDLNIAGIRGNLDTRIGKLENGEYDAILLAKAGLDRLGWADKISFLFETNHMLPAAGQGALGIEVRKPFTPEDEEISARIQSISDSISFQAVVAERAMLRQLQAGCSAPVGGLARFLGENLELEGVVLSADGATKLHARISSKPETIEEVEELGIQVANSLLDQGAEQFMLR